MNERCHCWVRFSSNWLRLVDDVYLSTKVHVQGKGWIALSLSEENRIYSDCKQLPCVIVNCISPHVVLFWNKTSGVDFSQYVSPIWSDFSPSLPPLILLHMCENMFLGKDLTLLNLPTSYQFWSWQNIGPKFSLVLLKNAVIIKKL